MFCAPDLCTRQLPDAVLTLLDTSDGKTTAQQDAELKPVKDPIVPIFGNVGEIVETCRVTANWRSLFESERSVIQLEVEGVGLDGADHIFGITLRGGRSFEFESKPKGRTLGTGEFD